MKGKPVKLSRDIDSINRPIERTASTKTVVKSVKRQQKPPHRKRRRDYDDILDDLWL